MLLPQAIFAYYLLQKGAMTYDVTQASVRSHIKQPSQSCLSTQADSRAVIQLLFIKQFLCLGAVISG